MMNSLVISVAVALTVGSAARAQEISEQQAIEPSEPSQSQAQRPPPDSRAALIEQQQADKAAALTPAKPGAAEAYVTRISDAFLAGQMHWHPFFKSAYSGGGFTLGAGYMQFVSAYNTLDVRGSITLLGLQAHRSRVHRAAPVPPARHARVHRRLARGDAGRLLRHRQHVTPYDRAPTTASSSRTASATVDGLGRRAICSSCAAASKSRSGSRSRDPAIAPSVETRSTRRRRCPASARTRPTCTRRARSASTRVRQPATRAAAASTASPSTTSPTPTRRSASRRWTTRRSSTSRSLREAWVLSLHGLRRRRLRQRRPGDPVLHAAVARRRSRPARVLELALPRPQQPAAAGRMARHRQPLPRHGGVLRRRQGRARRPRPELERSEERRRPRLPLPRADGDAAAHRLREGQRRVSHRVRGCGMRSERGPDATESHSLAACCCWRRWRAAAARTAGPRFYDDDPIAREPESRDASGAEPLDIDLFYEYATTCSSPAAPSRRTPARGTSTRSTKCPTRAGSPTASARADLPPDEIARGPDVGAPPAPEQWVIMREKTAGANPGFTARDANGETWFLAFDPPEHPEGATGGGRRSPRSCSGRSATTRSRRSSRRSIRAASTIDPKATVRRPSGERTPFTRDDMDAVLERAARNADGTYRVVGRRACCRARSSAASATRARGPTIRTTSFRTSTAASCARCASSAPGRT